MLLVQRRSAACFGLSRKNPSVKRKRIRAGMDTLLHSELRPSMSNWALKFPSSSKRIKFSSPSTALRMKQSSQIVKLALR